MDTNKRRKPERMYRDPEARGTTSRGGGAEELVRGVGVARLVPPLLSCSCHPFAASLDNSRRRGASAPLTATHRSSELILLSWQHAGDLGHAVTAPFSFAFFFPFLQSPKVISTSLLPLSSSLSPPSDLDIPRWFSTEVCVRVLRVCVFVCDSRCLP